MLNDLIRLLCLLTIALTGPAQDAAAGDEDDTPVVNIHAFWQPHRLNQDMTGPYGDFLTYLQKELKQPVEVYPNVVARAIRKFGDEPGSCFFPVSPIGITQLRPDLHGEDFIVSAPVDHVSGHVFWRTGASTVGSKGDLYGLSIGMLQSLTEQPAFIDLWKSHNVRPITVPSDIDAAKLLARRRVLHISGWAPDTILQLKSLGFDDYDHDKNFMLFQLTTHISCRLSPTTRKLIPAINRLIRRAQETGQMDSFFPAPNRAARIGETALNSRPVTGQELKIDIPPDGWIFNSGTFPLDLQDTQQDKK